MNFECTIMLDWNEKLFKSIKPEINSTSRSKINICRQTNKLSIRCQAKDAVALRASVSSITKLLVVYEKMDELQ